VRWAAYVPDGSSDGRRVAAPDEDAFTLVATAIERALGDPAEGARGATIDLVGAFPDVREEALGAVVGGPVELRSHPAGTRSFGAAIEAALTQDLGDRLHLVVAAELPERSVPADASVRSARGAGAIAVRLGDAGSSTTGALPHFRSEGSPLDTAWSVWAAHHASDPSRWVGDWDLDPAAGRPRPLAEVLAAADAPTGVVSEGAYVPRARYLENRPSRWRFVAEECGRCGRRSFPSRGICAHCGARDGLRPVLLPRDGGVVVASTAIGKGGQPTEFDHQVAARGGYGVVLVEFAPGARVTLQLTDAGPGALPIGSTVGTRLRRLYPMEGEWRYGRKAVPLAPVDPRS